MEKHRYALTWVVLLSILSCLPGESYAQNETCPELPAPFYGVLVYNGTLVVASEQPVWMQNDTVVLQCDRGYELTVAAGDSVGNTMEISCGENATWSSAVEQYTCTRISCGDPPTPTNGAVVLSSPNMKDFGSTADYSCSPGYRLSGAATVVCQWSGDWTTPPNCTDIVDCGDPPMVSNGEYSWTTGDAASIGTTVFYTCNSGYSLEGGDVVVCTESGAWSTAPKCDADSTLSSIQIIIIEGALAGVAIAVLIILLTCTSCYICMARVRQRKYVEDEEALAHSGAFTLSNPLVGVKDEDAAGNPLYLTPDELNEFEQQHQH